MRGTDQVYFQVVSGNGSFVDPAARRADRGGARRIAVRRAHLVGNAANILAERWPAHAPPPFKIDAQAAPDIAWVAWLGAAVSPNTAPAPSVLSARARRQTAEGPAAENLAAISVMMAWLSELWSGGAAAIEPATLRDAARLAHCMAHRSIAAGVKANSRSCWPSATRLVHRLRIGRKTIGFAVSRLAADEAEILSIAVASAIAAAACPAICC